MPTPPPQYQSNNPENDKVMPFGKHQCESFEDIPTKYLQWIYDNIEVEGRFTEAMYQNVEKELRRR